MATQLELRTPFTGWHAMNSPADSLGLDDALVRAAQQGDRNAFGALYARYSRMVHGILLSRVPHSAVEDLAQDVFLQALPRLQSLRDSSYFPGWLAAIARNRATDFHRRAKPDVELDEESPAARATSAAPLLVDTASGQQREKFLFYRGVSALLPPLTATLASDSTVQLQNHFTQQIPNVILFERRANKLGYRILGPLQDQASFSPPALDGSLDALFSDLEGLLISQGLYPDEAHAMLEAWKDSWFEDGSRLLYILPRAFVDSVLPLTVTPTPASTVRVFVGRLELITPATQQAVESAFATGDRAALAHYSRFLEPILQFMIQQSTDPARQQRLSLYLDSVYTDFYSRT